MVNKIISIVVPIYNVEKYLERCIDSIINQTYKNLEIILVNDGSTDDSGMICDNYKNKDNRIKVIHKKNGGLSEARNFGIDIATGTYIGFVDSDDWIETNMYERLLEKLEYNKGDISICGRYIDFIDKKNIVYKKQDTEKILNRKEALIELNSFSFFDMSACDKLYKKELFREIRFPVGKKCEDYYTMFKIFDKADKIICFSEPLYHYFQRDNSISRNIKLDTAFIDASKMQLEFFKEKYNDIIFVAETAVAFAYISNYNKAIKYNIKISDKDSYKEEVKKRLSYIKDNIYLSNTKKIQAFIFAKSIYIYKLIYKICT